MKRPASVTTVVILSLLALILTSCGGAAITFGVTGNTEKLIEITAKKADKDASFLVGSLEVSEGEQILIASNLTKGSVGIEIIKAPAEQSIDQVPELDGEAVIKANVSSTDETSGTVTAGSYYVRATCLERATGTIQIQVLSAP